MFITAVCVIFLINLASFQNKSFIVTKEKTNSSVLTVFSTSFFCSPLPYLLVLFAFFTVFALAPREAGYVGNSLLARERLATPVIIHQFQTIARASLVFTSGEAISFVVGKTFFLLS